jgi:hypothetical protein
MKKAEKLLREILSNPRSAEDGRCANDLLREFHRGFPPQKLRLLLSSPEVEVVKAGVFIAAELGSKAAPLLADIAKFLKHPAKWVRSDAIDCVLTCATQENENEIAAVVWMIDDPDEAIRWKVMEFLTRASSDQLRAALEYFETKDPQSLHVVGLRWLTSGGGRELAQIASWLCSEVPLRRRYAAVAAARTTSDGGEPLLLAASIDDDDVSQFADSMLKMRMEARGNR